MLESNQLGLLNYCKRTLSAFHTKTFNDKIFHFSNCYNVFYTYRRAMKGKPSEDIQFYVL